MWSTDAFCQRSSLMDFQNQNTSAVEKLHSLHLHHAELYEKPEKVFWLQMLYTT